MERKATDEAAFQQKAADSTSDATAAAAFDPNEKGEAAGKQKEADHATVASDHNEKDQAALQQKEAASTSENDAAPRKQPGDADAGAALELHQPREEAHKQQEDVGTTVNASDLNEQDKSAGQPKVANASSDATAAAALDPNEKSFLHAYVYVYNNHI